MYNIVVILVNVGKLLGLEVFSFMFNFVDYVDFIGSFKCGFNYFGDEIYSKEKIFEMSFVLIGFGGMVVSC